MTVIILEETGKVPRSNSRAQQKLQASVKTQIRKLDSCKQQCVCLALLITKKHSRERNSSLMTILVKTKNILI
jgi:hypothetical protein